MSVAENRHYERTIEELRLFIKKVLAEPDLIPKSLEITRELINEEQANVKIADQISASTNIKIPVEHSEADTIFLDALKEAVRNEHALY